MATASPPLHVKALYDYPGSHDDDLSFAANQIITVTEEEDADWYSGHYYEDSTGAKREGIFPKNFVKPFEPETPPRPSRPTRPKKDPEPSQTKQEEAPERVEKDAELHHEEKVVAPTAEEAVDIHTSVEDYSSSEPGPIRSSQVAAPVPPVSTSTKPSAPVRSPSTTSSKPPASIEKPATGSFRDRINAFNKPAAPPIAPIKPGGLSSGGSGFIKKPFVAPPPSKNAYVPPPKEPPPQKVYRREEEFEVTNPASNGLGPDMREDDSSALDPASITSVEEEKQQKPTSLKDRIALLQKQQAEQAARHSENAKKKEKPKRPNQQRINSQDPSMEHGDDVGDQDATRIRSIEGGEASLTAPQRSETDSAASPMMEASKEIQSDTNDADQSDLGFPEDQEDISIVQERPGAAPDRAVISPPQRPQHPFAGETSHQVDEKASDESGEEEEDVDPEVKRRMEIRERMAKMSGGMGMAGMFGPPGGLQPRKQSSMSSERKARESSGNNQETIHETRQPPITMMPMPGMAPAPRPKSAEGEAEVEQDTVTQPTSVRQGREPEEMPDMEDLKDETVAPSRRSTEHAMPAGPRDRPVPPLPPQRPEAPPPVHSERAPPPVPTNGTRPTAPQTPRPVLSPSEGSASDDEMSLMTRSGSYASPISAAKKMTTGGASPMLPHRPQAQRTTEAIGYDNDPNAESEKEIPGSTVVSSPIVPPPPKRASAVPPVPSQIPATPQSRAPPPPPPSAPPSRVSTGETRLPPPVPQGRTKEDSDVEITEYEGDYDTDIAADTTHKDALKRHERAESVDEDSGNEDSDLHHAGLPGLGPAPRAVPPPPPAQMPKVERRSTDTPRGPPPPPPPAKESGHQRNESYDPFNYMAPRAPPTIPSQPRQIDTATTPTFEEPRLEGSHAYPFSDRDIPPPLDRSPAQYPSSPLAPLSTSPAPRQSTDLQRNSTSVRRSMDASRPSGEHGSIAGDIDLSRQTQWWIQPNKPPPVLQGRKDVTYEIEDSNTTRRGGRQTTTRIVYILYMDYSQTNISVHFDPREPAEASFEQHHEPPPSRLRQDQLEDASSKFGAALANAMSIKKETVVGDGSPQALVLELLRATPDALLPIGNRAYGAVIYANLANASVQQFDEIRAGDIVSFRNAKFQGHRGTMHSKYSIEVGKPDHVGIVEDWDGTKKKIRAWEQGRESKKVKLESFKLGDMRSGEVKVWRVMSRQWVGWEGQN